MKKTVTVEVFEEFDTSWPGTNENPMTPLFFFHPITGEKIKCHYNSKNLWSDEDYFNAGFKWSNKRGWVWPVEIEE